MKKRTPVAESQPAPGLLARFLAADHKSWLSKFGLFLFLVAGVWFFGPLVTIGEMLPLVSLEGRFIAVLVLVGLFTLTPLIRRISGGQRIGAILLPGLLIMLALLAGGYVVHGFYSSNVQFAKLEWLLREMQPTESVKAFDDQGLGDTLIRVMPQLDALAELQRASDDFAGDLSDVRYRHVRHVAARVRRAYLRGIQNQLQPLLIRRLEQQLDGEYPDEFLYEALKVYLMLHKPEHRDADTMATWMSLSLEQELPRAARSNLEDHVQALAHLAGAVPLDESRVERVRSRLQQAPLSLRVYSGIRTAVNKELAPWRLSAQVPKRDLAHFVRISGLPLSDGIPGLYTAEGYQAFRQAKRDLLERQQRENWVLDDAPEMSTPNNRATLDRDLEADYARQFIRHWQAFLDDLQVAPVSRLEDLADTVNAFSSPSSPLKQVLQAVTLQTRLEPIESADRKGGLGRIVGNPKLSGLLTKDRDRHAQEIVQRHFRDVNSLFDSDAGGPAAIDAAIEDLSDLKRFLDAVSFASDLDDKLLDGLLKNPNGRAIMRRVTDSAARQPSPLKYWLQAVSRFDFLQASALTVSRTIDEINTAWRSDALPQCETMLNGRYPLETSSAQDMPIADFARLFAAGGVFDRFWQQHLEPYVDTESRPWQTKRQISLSLARRSLAFFERVAAIRSALFSEQRSTPRLILQIKPLALSADIAQVTLASGDQSLRYRHGPPQIKSLSWPSSGEQQARIAFSKAAGPDSTSSIVTEGPWALFRLLDRAKAEVSDSNRGVRLTFEQGDGQAVFLLGTATAGAFVPSLFEGLRCPETL